jgi:hypothetical protein
VVLARAGTLPRYHERRRRASARRFTLSHEDLRRHPQDRERNWVLVDAEGKTLGRLATQIADALRGKRKPTTRRTSTWATSWSS